MNQSKNFYIENLEDIDKTNNDSLDNITFIKKSDTSNKFNKSDNYDEFDNFDNSDQIIKKHSNILLYSQYFIISNSISDENQYKINYSCLRSEIIIIILLQLFFGINNAIFNVITIDGVLSCLLFYMNYMTDNNTNFLSNYHLSTIDRYIYYIILIIGYYIIIYTTWFFSGFVARYIVVILISPNIMCQIYNIYTYKKIRNVLYDGYNNLIRKIICKQMAKIINLTIKNVIKSNTIVDYKDLESKYDTFSLEIIGNFVGSFIVACLIRYMDSIGLRYFTAIYKKYIKDPKYDIKDDKQYITTIINDKKWEKLVDIYTLSKIVRLCINSDNDNSFMVEQISNILKTIMFKINRVMLCWTILSITSKINIGIFGSIQFALMGFMLFVPKLETAKYIRYISTVILFVIMSFFTMEKLLVIMACEIALLISDSKIIFDIIFDIYKALRSIALRIYSHTNTITLGFSCILFLFSILQLKTVIFTIISLINCVILFSMYSSDTTEMNSKINIKKSFIQSFGILIFGYISNFNPIHCIGLPIIMQYISDNM